MPRIARIVVPNIPHHVTQRGNYQQDVFLGDKDKFKYLSLLKEYSFEYNIEVLAYCLMSNHVHLVLVPSESDALGKMLNIVSMKYAQYFNKRLGKRGHLWQDRYFSCPLDEDHLYEVVRYVENNPVKFGIVKYAEDYYWSSAKSHLSGKVQENELLADYTKYLERIDNWKEYLTENPKESVINNLRKCTKRGRPAGNERFIRNLEEKIGRKLTAPPRGRSWRQE